MSTTEKPSETLIHKTTTLMQDGFRSRIYGEYSVPEALGDARWTDELILSTWYMAETGKVPSDMNYRTGKSNGGFDRLDFFINPFTLLSSLTVNPLSSVEVISPVTIDLVGCFEI